MQLQRGDCFLSSVHSCQEAQHDAGVEFPKVLSPVASSMACDQYRVKETYNMQQVLTGNT